MSKVNPFKIQSFFFRTGFGYDSGMSHTRSILRFSRNREAQFRLEVIEFQKKWGTRAALDAYKVGRATLFRWKKTLLSAQGRLEFLEFPFEYADVEGLGRLFYTIVQAEIKTVFGWKRFDLSDCSLPGARFG